MSNTPFCEFLVCPSCGIASTANSDGLKYTAGAKLTQNLLRNKFPSLLLLVRFDAADVVDIRYTERVH